MIVKSKRDDYASLYQFLTATTQDKDGNPHVSIVEFSDENALDAKGESMLNNEGYAKSDFIVVKYIDYQIDANGYSDGSAVAEQPENDN